MKNIIEQAKDLFESITCLCAEGPEFMKKLELTEAISKEAIKGFNLCKENLQQQDSADKCDSCDYYCKHPRHEFIYCPVCGHKNR